MGGYEERRTYNSEFSVLGSLCQGEDAICHRHVFHSETNAYAGLLRGTDAQGMRIIKQSFRRQTFLSATQELFANVNIAGLLGR